MSKIWSLLFFLSAVSVLQAQYKVQFILEEQTTIRHDSIYLVGTFNNWDSLSNGDYLMKPLEDGRKTITLNLPKGPIKYKFHRGSWLNVEKYYNNREVVDREVYISGDTVLVDSVQGWRDEIFKDKQAALAQHPVDSIAIIILSNIAWIYAFSPDRYNVDSAFHYAQKAIDRQENSANVDIAHSPALLIQSFLLKDVVASLMHSLGNYPKALEIKLQNVRQAEEVQNSTAMTYALLSLTEEYVAMEDYENSLLYGKRAEKFLQFIEEENAEKLKFTGMAFRSIAEAYYHLGKLDSALIYAVKWEPLVKKTDNPIPHANYNLLLGDIYRAKGDFDAALNRYKQISEKTPAWLGHIIANSKVGTAKVYQARNQFRPALGFALEALHFYQNNRTQVQTWGENTDSYIAEVSPLVADLYMKIGKPDSAYHFLQLSIALKDSLYNKERIRQFQTLSFNEDLRQQQLEQQKKDAQQQFETRLKIYGLMGVLIAALLFGIFQIRNNKQKQTANKLLEEQKKALEQTLEELKAAQSQLIQAEKMASLGELTAGIAHEIQNPLNFVNNFSDLSVDLTEELKLEIGKLDIPAQHMENVGEILSDLASNQQKINHHGKRASGIVSGMLQHARTSSGAKELIDLNALADEYLLLAYHGLRAKDSTFNAKIVTQFDPAIGMVNVIPQAIGRAVLNIINNALYATQQRAKSSDNGNLPYEPTVTISSKKENGQVVFKIKDNGTGIPEDVKAKIFQPFFTTKPTGQGTGLGLSLAYDIVTKGHGGALEVETKEGAYTIFKIILPYKIGA